MIIRFKTFKNGATVLHELNPISGLHTVLLRAPNGSVHDKVSCDTRRDANDYRRAFEKIVKNL